MPRARALAAHATGVIRTQCQRRRRPISRASDESGQPCVACAFERNASRSANLLEAPREEAVFKERSKRALVGAPRCRTSEGSGWGGRRMRSSCGSGTRGT